MQVRKEMSMERDYIERNAVLEEALSDKAVRGGLADKTDIKRIIADVISADVVSVREYQKLAGENRELKRLLKLAIADFEFVTKMCDETQCENCPHNYMRNYPCDCCEWQYKDEAEKLLKGDTVEAVAEFQPVVHAKWVLVRKYRDEDGYINEIFRCSNCKIPRDRKFSFCPSCGAKTDGD